jgi:hypothetical protein
MSQMGRYFPMQGNCHCHVEADSSCITLTRFTDEDEHGKRVAGVGQLTHEQAIDLAIGIIEAVEHARRGEDTSLRDLLS